MQTQGSNLQHKEFPSFSHLSNLLETELSPSYALRFSHFGRKQRRARGTSHFHRERDAWERGRKQTGGTTRQGLLMCLVAPASQTQGLFT